jgi:lipoprotein-anchoring transpeptidase ErfK/SrfK
MNLLVPKAINRSVLTTLVVAVWSVSMATAVVLQRQATAKKTAQTTASSESAAGWDGVLSLPPSSPTPTPGSGLLWPLPPGPPAPSAPSSKPPPKPVIAAPCVSTARACVDLSARRAWLLDNGKIVFGPTRISPGKPGQRTPTGTFQVQWKNKDHRSREFDDAPMPFSVFFAPGGIAFHAGSLQTGSAGCVRLAKSVAGRFFATLEVGDTVQVVP